MRLVLTAIMAYTLTITSAWSVNVTLDFRFDEDNFFGAGNPDGAAAGAQARATLQAAADFYSGIIGDSLSSIETPDPISSEFFPGVATFQWQRTFTNPATGSTTTLTNSTIPEDEYIVFAGGRGLPGNTLGIGGSGGSSVSSDSNGGFTQAEIDEINMVSADFFSAVTTRGQPEDEFSRWGGAVTFDGDGSTNWHFGLDTLPSSGESDFFSVALHELGHALGFGGTSEWNDLVSGGVFTGAESTRVFGSNPPIAPGHLAEDLQSTVLGTNTPQEVAFDPLITVGDRKLVTTLDAASLVDIGWEIDLSVTTPPGDYNGDLIVDAADYAIWRTTAGTPGVIGSFVQWSANFGAGVDDVVSVPEPGALLLALGGALTLGLKQRRRSLC